MMSIIDNLNRHPLNTVLGCEENVMEKYYEIKFNLGVQLVKEMTINRLLRTHGSSGYVTLSAYKAENGELMNDASTKELIRDIKTMGYHFLPIYGGLNKSDYGSINFKPSFIVINHYNAEGSGDFSRLIAFALDMCRKHNQESVLIAPPNQPPYHADRNGNTVCKPIIHFDGYFINPQPQNLNERRRRSNGEIMLVDDNGENKWNI